MWGKGFVLNNPKKGILGTNKLELHSNPIELQSQQNLIKYVGEGIRAQQSPKKKRNSWHHQIGTSFESYRTTITTKI